MFIKELLESSYQTFANAVSQSSEAVQLQGTIARLKALRETPEGRSSYLDWNRVDDWVFEKSMTNPTSLIAMIQGTTDNAQLLGFLQRHINVHD
jgi:hypothetical protein